MDRPGLGIVGDVAQLIVTLAAAICLVTPYGALGITTALVAGRTTGSLIRWLTLWLLMNVPQRCEPETA